jgi:hypothetical protein
MSRIGGDARPLIIDIDRKESVERSPKGARRSSPQLSRAPLRLLPTWTSSTGCWPQMSDVNAELNHASPRRCGNSGRFA